MAGSVTVLPGAGDYLATNLGQAVATTKLKNSQAELDGLRIQNEILAKRLSHVDEMYQLDKMAQQSDIDLKQGQIAQTNQALALSRELESAQKRTAAAKAASAEAEVGQQAGKYGAEMESEHIKQLASLGQISGMMANKDFDAVDSMFTAVSLADTLGVDDKAKEKTVTALFPIIQAQAKGLKQQYDFEKQKNDALVMEHRSQALQQALSAGLGDPAVRDAIEKNGIAGGLDELAKIFGGTNVSVNELPKVRGTEMRNRREEANIDIDRREVIGWQQELRAAQTEYNQIRDRNDDEKKYEDKVSGKKITYGARKRQLETEINDLKDRISSGRQRLNIGSEGPNRGTSQYTKGQRALFPNGYIYVFDGSKWVNSGKKGKQ